MVATLPDVGAPDAPVLPAIERSTLANGLRVWSMRHDALPIAAIALVIRAGSVDDRPDLPGLVACAADVIDEGTGDLDAIAIADRWARLGGSLETDVLPDATTFGTLVLSGGLGGALTLLSECLLKPTVAPSAVRRVRELRLNRLRQLQDSAGAAADRVFLRAVLGGHGYAHTPLGTTAAMSTLTREDVLDAYARLYRPDAATLIVAGDVTHDALVALARDAFGAWQGGRGRPIVPAPLATGREPTVWLVHRGGAPQSELRLGHLGVPRATPDYHALITLNWLLGGQFSSRINQRLRQDKGYTYGARTTFDAWRTGGIFECSTSVQADATGAAIADAMAECAAVGTTRPPDAGELARTVDSLARGYVRQFETPAQLVRAAAQLVIYDLPDDTVERFVPSITGLDAGAVHAAAHAHLHPERFDIVIVGDAERVRPQLADVGRPVVAAAAEF